MNPGDNVLSTLKCLGMFGRCVYVPHITWFHSMGNLSDEMIFGPLVNS